MALQGELVTIARYPFRGNAEAVRLALEARGIPAVVTDWHMPVSWLWILNHEAQWAELQVLATDARRAVDIIGEVERRRLTRRWKQPEGARNSDQERAMADTDEFDRLESQVYGLRLQVATLYRLLVTKGVATADELRRLMEQVDAEDGTGDGEFYGDVVEGPPENA